MKKALRDLAWTFLGVLGFFFVGMKFVFPLFANVFEGLGVEIPIPRDWVFDPVKRWTLISIVAVAVVLMFAALVMKARKRAG